MPARIAGICGLAAFVTVNIGWIAGGLAQPAAYSVANDDISDLGAMTAVSPWIYNQVGANLTGILVVLLGLGLWRALSPDVIGRIGAAVLIAEGISTFFDGIFHLASAVSGECEADFDLGYRVNLTGTWQLLEALRETAQLTGLSGLLYFSANSSSSGGVSPASTCRKYSTAVSRSSWAASPAW